MARKRPSTKQTAAKRVSAPTGRPGKVIVALTVREILDEELAKKLA